MEHSSRYADTLRMAAETLGGIGRLAAFLGVPPDTVRAWLADPDALPLEAFLTALDVLADGPFAPRQRPIRVAVLPEDANR